MQNKNPFQQDVTFVSEFLISDSGTTDMFESTNSVLPNFARKQISFTNESLLVRFGDKIEFDIFSLL